MNSTTLQILVNKNIRDQATSVAEKMGFSSLQEVVRLFLNKMAAREIDVTFEQTFQLSLKAAKRYDSMIDEIESGKAKIKFFSDTDSLMRDLNENRV